MFPRHRRRSLPIPASRNLTADPQSCFRNSGFLDRHPRELSLPECFCGSLQQLTTCRCFRSRFVSPFPFCDSRQSLASELAFRLILLRLYCGSQTVFLRWYLFRDRSLKLSGSSDSGHLTLAWIEIYSYSRSTQQQKSRFPVSFLCRTCPFCGEPWKRSCYAENCTIYAAFALISNRQKSKR